MANSRPNVQLFGYPVKLRDEQEVPGFRVRPPEEEVPGFRMNPDGSVRLPAEGQSSLAGYISPSVIAAITHPPLEPRIRRGAWHGNGSGAWAAAAAGLDGEETDLVFRPSC